MRISKKKKKLSDIFEFVFFDSPFESAAGPAILLTFTYKKYGPHYIEVLIMTIEELWILKGSIVV